MTKRNRTNNTSISSSSSSSVERVLNNGDLLTQILLRIPARPLLNLKIVSKQWHSLISNRQFRLSHTLFHHLNPNFTTPNTLLLYRNIHSRSLQFLYIPLSRHHSLDQLYFSHPLYADASVLHTLEIEQECNGLFVYSYYNSYTETRTFFICNHTTMRYKAINCPREIRKSVFKVFLAFDPSVSPCYSLISVRLNRVFFIDLYSFETHSWSLLGIEVPIEVPDANIIRTRCFQSPVYYKGAIHWHDECASVLLYFDIETKSIKKMPKFPPPGYSAGVKYFGESGGYLQLVMSKLDDGGLKFSKFDVFELASDYSEWIVRYHVDLYSIQMAFPELDCGSNLDERPSILSVLCCEEKKDSMIVLYLDGVALAYNFYHDASWKLCQVMPMENGAFRVIDYSWRFNRAFPIVETLFCL